MCCDNKVLLAILILSGLDLLLIYSHLDISIDVSLSAYFDTSHNVF
jgi:hypothetical protein